MTLEAKLDQVLGALQTQQTEIAKLKAENAKLKAQPAAVQEKPKPRFEAVPTQDGGCLVRISGVCKAKYFMPETLENILEHSAELKAAIAEAKGLHMSAGKASASGRKAAVKF